VKRRLRPFIVVDHPGGFEDAVLTKHVTWIGAIALIHATSALVR
jgi:hypothetical protein